MYLPSLAAITPAVAPTTNLALVVTIIAIALAFDFLNGFHDAANSIATVVSTRVLTPTQAVIWAAAFNFIAAFVFGTGVASLISHNLVRENVIDVYVVFGGLLGAIAWNVITWLLALPTSSSHALVGAIAGAAVTKAGSHAILIGWGWGLILLFLFLSPLIGFFLGGLNMVVVAWLFRRATPHRVDVLFRRLQLFSAGIYSLGHGGNDAQKTMGIIVMLLIAAGKPQWCTAHYNMLWHHHEIALWIILSCQAAIALGTMFGGWRIVKTMGSGITKLTPVGGFCAELSAATTIIGATFGHIPISTTHAITGSILGVGTVRNVRSVRWIWGQRIVTAWVLTIPCAAFIAGVSYGLIHLLLEPAVR
jgi:PiT family inorganic phosphate transporter